jgi:dTDP-4-amino-4,6-dideoxygalactose transaminase
MNNNLKTSTKEAKRLFISKNIAIPKEEKEINEIKQKKVPYMNFVREYKSIENEIDNAYKNVMEQGWFILGPELARFENEFAKYCEAKYAVGVASGIDALILVLDAWGVGPGDEVIVAANTYIASAFAATQVGATPVFVDINPETFNIDVNKIEEAITEKTRVILPTHLYGQMVDMTKIMSIAKKYNLKVLEDAAQSHGASQRGKACGSHGHAVAFSFYPTKNLGCYGDGGAIVTNNSDLYQTLLHLRNNGSKTKFYYDYVGYNSRLDEMQAAFLRIKLRHLNSWNRRRQELAIIYENRLKKQAGITIPRAEAFNNHTWHVYCIRVHDGKRDKLIEFLDERGIGHNIHYPMPPHLQNCYKDLGYRPGDLPVTETIVSEILSLPLSAFHSEAEINLVVNTIKEFYKIHD